MTFYLFCNSYCGYLKIFTYYSWIFSKYQMVSLNSWFSERKFEKSVFLKIYIVDETLLRSWPIDLLCINPPRLPYVDGDLATHCLMNENAKKLIVARAFSLKITPSRELIVRKHHWMVEIEVWQTFRRKKW